MNGLNLFTVTAHYIDTMKGEETKQFPDKERAIDYARQRSHRYDVTHVTVITSDRLLVASFVGRKLTG